MVCDPKHIANDQNVLSQQNLFILCFFQKPVVVIDAKKA